MWRFPKRFLKDDGWIVGGDHVARIVVKNASLLCASNIVRSLLRGLVHPTDRKGSRSFKIFPKILYLFYEEREFRFTLIHGCTSFVPNFCQVAMMKRTNRMITFFWIYYYYYYYESMSVCFDEFNKVDDNKFWEAWFSEILSVEGSKFFRWNVMKFSGNGQFIKISSVRNSTTRKVVYLHRVQRASWRFGKWNLVSPW